MDREAWRAVIHGVAKSWTWLSDWTELLTANTNKMVSLLLPLFSNYVRSFILTAIKHMLKYIFMNWRKKNLLMSLKWFNISFNYYTYYSVFPLEKLSVSSLAFGVLKLNLHSQAEDFDLMLQNNLNKKMHLVDYVEKIELLGHL